MMNSPDQFVGGQFTWFTGVVEDILDPAQMGRVRVRCFGYHTSNIRDLPTTDLPWASVMMPITSASMSGIGQSATGVLQGSWVIGFFRDGPSAQDPIVLGTIPSRSTRNESGSGFADPTGTYPLGGFNNNPDTPYQSTSEYDNSSSFIARAGGRQLKIETAVPPKTDTVSIPKTDSYYARSTWDEKDPNNHTGPIYPRCHTICTESGHVFEIDDTLGKSRILRQHNNGTYEEWVDDGDRTIHVKKDNYEIIMGTNSVYVKGSCNLTIDRDLRVLVKGNYHLEVEGDYTQKIKGSIQTKIGGNEEKEIQFTSSENVGKDRNLRVGGNETITLSGDRNETISQALNQDVVGDASYTITGTKNEIVLEDLKTVTTGKLYFTAQSGVQIETPNDIDITGDSDMNITVIGNMNETVSGDQTTTVSGAIEITGATIDLNP